jgi:DNA-binding NarL/FixJ family response regulator
VKLRVRVQANRQVVGEAVAAAIQDLTSLPVIADTTDPHQVHKASRPPDVVVLIGSVSDASTSAAVRNARRRWRHAVVIVLAETDRVQDGVSLVRQGADIWVSPHEGLDALRAVLKRIANGERILLPPDAIGYMAASLADPLDPQALLEARLTSREMQVLECFAIGLSRPDIAAMLSISRATLRTHVQNILHKLNFHSIDEAASVVAIQLPAGQTDRPPIEDRARGA